MTDAEGHPGPPLLLACRAVGRAVDLVDEAACRAFDSARVQTP